MAEDAYSPQAVKARTVAAVRARGLRPVVGDYARFATGLLAGTPATFAGSRGEFTFGGQRYPYLFHRYKRTWLTERTVEVPVVQAIVDRHADERVLEVGSVLAHYRAQTHLVVDKYEKAPGVLNRDVLDLDDLGLFDLVVSVSTLEHVGWDEEPRDPGKALEGLRRLQALLAPGGRLVLTIPMGYHPVLEAALESLSFPFASAGVLRRQRIGPHWREIRPQEAWGTPYDFLLYSARAVFVGIIERPAA